MNLHRGNDMSVPAAASAGGTPVRKDPDAPGASPAEDATTAPGARSTRTDGTDAERPTSTQGDAPTVAKDAPAPATHAPARTQDTGGPAGAAPGTAAPGISSGTAAAPGTGSGAEGLSRRMDRAVGGFVDDPKGAVREADAVLDEAARLLARRREELRRGWDGSGAGSGADTEQLRLALTRYRDLTRQVIDLATAS